MSIPDALVARWWELFVGAHVAMFVIGLGLWFTGNEPLAMLLILFALLLPLAIIAVKLDGID